MDKSISIEVNRNHQSYNSKGVLSYNYKSNITFQSEEKYDKYRKYQYILAREREEEECQRRREERIRRENYVPPKPKTNEERFEDLPEWRKRKVREIMGL